MSLYFAYGSNMNKDQMLLRCPKAEPIITHKLKDYKFRINSRGVATIVPELDSFVEGVLWGISKKCEKSLDRYEGVSRGIYRKEYIPLTNGLFALVYIASDESRGVPRDSYLEGIIQTAISLSFSKSYVVYLRTLL